ncbi:hypothetical protein LguiB_004014 [Lonicera macranthoides]
MLKRQDSALSSSSRRETPLPENHKPKAIGCVSGIFQLFSKYQNRRKFITFGKKHEKKSAEGSPIKPQKPLVEKQTSHKVADNEKRGEINCDIINRKLSCEVPRSPTLPPEIRQSNSVNSPESFKTQPSALVARLMGLEEMQLRTQKFDKSLNSGKTSCGSVHKETSSSPAGLASASASEKRRKLLGALEKCDEDLKVLKKVIETARSAEHIRSPAIVNEEGCGDFNSERWRSVLLLDELTRLPLGSYTKKRANGRMPQQWQQKPTLTKKPGENDVIDLSFLEKVRAEASHRKCESTAASPTLWSSKAMIESVNEVCKDIAWGEKREIGRIGLVLQDNICRDLIEEIVMELGCFRIYSLPFEACKRKLCF